VSPLNGEMQQFIRYMGALHIVTGIHIIIIIIIIINNVLI